MCYYDNGVLFFVVGVTEGSSGLVGCAKKLRQGREE